MIRRDLIPPTQADLIALDLEKRRAIRRRFAELHLKFRLSHKGKIRLSIPNSLVKVIAAHEAGKIGVDPAAMFGQRRTTNAIAFARWRVMRRLRKYGYSTPAIALALGGMNHTSILHGLRRIAEMEARH